MLKHLDKVKAGGAKSTFGVFNAKYAFLLREFHFVLQKHYIE
jgi:hypothetical protein